MSWSVYPKYQDSDVEWLGIIPAHWCSQRLKFLGDISASGIDKNSSENESQVRFLGTDSVYSRQELNNSMDLTVCTASQSEIERLCLRYGDIVLTKDSVVPTRIADTAIVVEPLEDVVCGYHLIRVRLDTEIADPRFLFYHLLARQVNEFLLSMARGTTIIGLSSDVVGGAYLCCPPLDEQANIAAFLDHETARIDALIEEQQRLIDLLQEKRQAVITHAVTKGLDTTVPLIDSGVVGIGRIPKHWKVVSIRTLLGQRGYKAGPFGSSLITGDLDNRGDIIVLSPENVAKQEILLADALYLPRERLLGMEQFTVQAGDVVIPIVGTLGRSWVFPGGATAILNQRLARLSVDAKKIYPEYLSILLSKYSFFKQLDEADTKGATITHITRSALLARKIPLPPLEEQAKILSYVNSAEQSLWDLEYEAKQGVEVLKERRSALISTAVTGKIDVRGWKPQNAPVESELPRAAEPEAPYG